jgi:chitodextrinase
MKPWRLTALAGLLAAGITPAALAATATLYYATASKGWAGANIHHNASGTWTTVPGTAMAAACTGWTVATVTSPASTFQAVFNNGANVWDNPAGGGNYTIADGVHQVRNGAIVANAGNPCATSATNSATVFYKPNTGWTTVNIHYATNGGAWTTAPGVPMDTACTGWRRKVISLGAATGLAITFNNGATWDNNSGRNYALGTGSQKVENGAVTAGDPCEGIDIVPPSVPTGLAKTGATTSSVSLAWTASSDVVGVTGYEVFRNGVSAGTSTSPNFTASGLGANTAYSFTVRARDAAGNWSAQGVALSAATAAPEVDTVAPTVPAGLTATTSGTSITVRWAASTDTNGVAGYTVSRTGGAAPASTNVTGTTFNDTGAAQTTYGYTVTAVDAAGNRSAPSAAVTV